jgi:hypothetical protein
MNHDKPSVPRGMNHDVSIHPSIPLSHTLSLLTHPPTHSLNPFPVTMWWWDIPVRSTVRAFLRHLVTPRFSREAGRGHEDEDEDESFP